MGVVRKIRRSLKRSGILKTLILCVRNILPARYGGLPARYGETDPQFDLDYGVSTEGVVELGDLNINAPSDLWGFAYAPTPTDVFDRVLKLLPATTDTYSFVDLGAGKGRVVLMASRKPFKSVIGVEFSSELCAVAESNLAKFKPHMLSKDVQMVCTDAALFEFPQGPLIVYLYHSFTKEVLVKVLDRLSRRSAETIFVFYNVHYKELFDDFEIISSEHDLCIWRIKASR